MSILFIMMNNLNKKKIFKYLITIFIEKKKKNIIIEIHITKVY